MIYGGAAHEKEKVNILNINSFFFNKFFIY